MGWTSSYKWYNPTVLRKEYAEDIARSGKFTVVGWEGSWLKVINNQSNRPFVIDVMVRKFGKDEYGYKDVEGSSGPYETNQRAARWLRRELAKRGMEPEGYEGDWLARCDRAAESTARLKSFKPGDVIEAVRSFELCDGYTKYKAGDKFRVQKVSRGKVYCFPSNASWPYMRLSKEIFLSPRKDEE